MDRGTGPAEILCQAVRLADLRRDRRFAAADEQYQKQNGKPRGKNFLHCQARASCD